MGLNRRKFLSTVGAVTIGSSISGRVKATPDTPVRVLKPSVADINGIDSVVVELYQNGTLHIQMSGSARKYPGPFLVKPRNVYNRSGEYRPDKAEVEVVTPDGRGMRGDRRTGGEEEQNSPSSIGSLSHSGSDNEYDYEGGMYCTSKDPVYAAVCATDQWLKWGGSAGNLYWTARKYKWTVWDYQKSTWEKEDAGFDGGVDITHYFVTTNAYGDYYNWNWNDPDKKTTAHHRLRLSGAHSGYIDWGSDHWHTGEDAGNLWAEVGPHSKYP